MPVQKKSGNLLKAPHISIEDELGMIQFELEDSYKSPGVFNLR